MSARIHDLLNRNLQEVSGEGDAARRRAAIEELYTDDCVLYVPPGVFVGHDALDLMQKSDGIRNSLKKLNSTFERNCCFSVS